MEKVFKVFRSFEDADRAEKEYYQSLTGEERLRILWELNHSMAKLFYPNAPERIEKVYRIIKFSPTNPEA